MFTDKLKSYLVKSHCFEEEAESLRRELALSRLELVFEKWVAETSKRNNLLIVGSEVKGMLLTLGSYKLGVHGPDADIDILLIVPHSITREDCFNQFYEELLSLCCYGNESEGVAYVRKIEKTFIPVIKLKLLGVDIDIAVTRLGSEEAVLPTASTELLDDMWLKGMDIHSFRSLNGFRDCQNILNIIQPCRMDSFRLTLRAVKLWASRRAIYNNSIGYFSGMALTVLLTKIFQVNPQLTDCYMILREFFNTYANWAWPNPVKLNYLEANNVNAPVCKVWNPHVRVFTFDKSDRMPILTPSYPQRNSSYTSTISTRRVITQEFRRAHRIMEEGSVEDDVWETIFDPQDFFIRTDFTLYLVLSAESHGEQQESFNHWDWCAVARSQVRRLIADIELLDNIVSVCVCPNAYPHPDCEEGASPPLISLWFIGIILTPGGAIDFESYFNNFKHNVTTYCKEHDIPLAGKLVNAKVVESSHGLTSSLPAGIGHGVKGRTMLKEPRKGFFHFSGGNNSTK